MTGTASAWDVVQAARRQNALLAAERERLVQADVEHKSLVRRIEGEIAAAWDHLAEVLVPDLGPATLDPLARRLGLPAIAAAAVAARIEKDLVEQRTLVAAVDADPQYVQREAVLNEVSIRTAELDDAIGPLQATLTDLEYEPVLEELLAVRYGTEQYAGRFWELSYYRHWKHGDLLVERHGRKLGVQDFPALLAKYREHQAALATLESEKARYTAQRARIDELVETKRRAEDALAKMDERHLTATRARVRGHLEPLEPATIVQLLSDLHGARLAAQRIAGLLAKKRYLDEMHAEWIAKPRAAIDRAMQKNARDMTKLSRPKSSWKTFPRADFDRRFRDRRDSWEKRWRRYDEARTRVVAFHDYGRWDPVRDVLWWDLMTDGRVDGDFIPEVHAHHQAHGRMDAAAHAVAEESRAPAADLGYDAS